jgi:hypothetical protein
MRDVLILLVHLIVTLIRLARPCGIRAVVAESVLGEASTRDLESFAEAST